MKIVIAGTCRTPIGKAPGGKLKDWTAVNLLVPCFQETLKRASNPAPVFVDHVIVGTVMHSSDAPNIARVAALKVYIHESVPAFSVQRNCGSGLQAIVSAVQMIKAGDAQCVLIGGAESMSSIPFVIRGIRKGQGIGNDPRVKMSNFVDALTEGLTDPITGESMGMTAENVAGTSVTRKDQDLFAANSHKKAMQAARSGKFKEQTVILKDKKGQIAISTDECVNPTLNPQVLSMYPAIFKENGTVTPGNSCPLSDGASSLLVMTEACAERNRITPEAEVIAYQFSGCNPSYMGLGPVTAINQMMEHCPEGIRLADVDIIELNEAFAAQAIACQRFLEIPDQKLNVWGGAIALGHPVGATGAILVAKAVAIMKDQKKNLAITSMCIGGGQGGAMLIRNM